MSASVSIPAAWLELPGSCDPNLPGDRGLCNLAQSPVSGTFQEFESGASGNPPKGLASGAAGYAGAPPRASGAMGDLADSARMSKVLDVIHAAMTGLRDLGLAARLTTRGGQLMMIADLGALRLPRAPVVASPRVWTPAMDARLLEMRADGQTPRTICAEMKVTERSMYARLCRLRRAGHDVAAPQKKHGPGSSTRKSFVRGGVEIMVWQPDDLTRLIALFEGGTAIDDIAQQMGRSAQAVLNRLTMLRGKGLVTSRRRPAVMLSRWTEAEHASLRAAWGQKALDEIAADLGRGAKAVALKARALGLSAPHRAGALEQKLQPKARAAVKARVAPVPVAKAAPVAEAPTVSARILGTAARTPALVSDVAVVAGYQPVEAWMTAGEKARVVAAWLAMVRPGDLWSPEVDLALAEDAFSGAGVGGMAEALEISVAEAAARFRKLARPFCQPGVHALPIETAGFLLPALRARAGVFEGVDA